MNDTLYDDGYMNAPLYNVGTYIRISREDKNEDASISIENQRTMLSQFIAHMPNWIDARVYIDDGASGGNFNRKGFQDMMEDARRGIINLVLVKDLSRFGRNYIEAGRYLEEELPALGCRFVSLADNIDTQSGENDIIPFINAINDFYIRDVSKRIKSVMRAKAEAGQKLTGVAPYGYIKNPMEYTKLAIDSTAAKIVRRVFEMRASGMGYTSIAGVLNKEGILSPRAYYFKRLERKINTKNSDTSSCAKIWGMKTVKLILNNEVYIGNTISLKRGTRSYRDSRSYIRDKSAWIKIENTHPPIIEAKLWDKVQRINNAARIKMKNRRKPRHNPFAGLLICIDCGAKMSRTNKTYHCATHSRSGKAACTSHSIKDEHLKQLVISHINGLVAQMNLDENAILKKLRAKLSKGYAEDKLSISKQKQLLNRQLNSLEYQFDQLYEKRQEGKISAKTFKELAVGFEKKREDAENLHKALCQAEQETDAKLADIGCADIMSSHTPDKWTFLIKEKSSFIEAEQELLKALIEKIEIGEKSESDGLKQQEIKIFYKT